MPEPDDILSRAEALNTALREISDMLMGGVQTLIAEGWTEEQARSLVLAAFAASRPR
jgi:predicted RNase H-like HicB family nuclease